MWLDEAVAVGGRLKVGEALLVPVGTSDLVALSLAVAVGTREFEYERLRVLVAGTLSVELLDAEGVSAAVAVALPDAVGVPG